MTSRHTPGFCATKTKTVNKINHFSTVSTLTVITARERIISLRSAIATRRQTLDDAYRTTSAQSPPRTPTPTPPGGHPRGRPPTPPRKSQRDQTQELINECTQAHLALQDALARARQGLVQELVDVFAVVEVGGRPAAGVRAATRGEWAIGGLVLPVPGDMRRMHQLISFNIFYLLDHAFAQATPRHRLMRHLHLQPTSLAC